MKPARMTQAEHSDAPIEHGQIPDLVAQSFGYIAPSWPLENLIAVNPLQGLESMPIEEALTLGAAYFQQADLPAPMASVNRETIKWLQAYCDEGQATIAMPLRPHGLYAAWRPLVVHDARLQGEDRAKKDWLRALPAHAEEAIAECLLRLGIAKQEREPFLTLMLTTLPGWASYVKYRTEWTGSDSAHPHPLTQLDYLAMRLIITSLLWPEAKALLAWHQEALLRAKSRPSPLENMQRVEQQYRVPLLQKLAAQPLNAPRIPDAQLVFCIDVRSEPFRRALEATGDYQTLGFAGFFGVPLRIADSVTGESYASCPVLLSPQHTVQELPCCPHTEHASTHDRQGYARLAGLKRLYQSAKYTFISPFALVETLGVASGVWMGLRSLAPRFAFALKTSATHTLRKPMAVVPSLDGITLKEQCAYAEGALRMMGLTHHFAPLVVLCGHGSATQNNAYATALDCGACGGRHGASNARVLAAMLNRAEVREALAAKGIHVPQRTRFLAAEHNTTTDEVVFSKPTEIAEEFAFTFLELKANLAEARAKNSAARLTQMQVMDGKVGHAVQRAQDWAQVRPEWGLARNAAMIVAPRALTSALNLEGRAFLHSYDEASDPGGAFLTTILTAPMVVAQWINSQYLFSTLDNVAYGGGSKITKNITGKMGIMQGNASDLMTGLPLQSVYASDRQAYHVPQRLLTVVYAPRQRVDAIIAAQPVLQKLFGHGWVQLACIEPETRQIQVLQRDMTWQMA